MGNQLKLGADILKSLLAFPFCPNNRQLIGLLRHRKLVGEPLSSNFIHEADAYSAAPADLVIGREHAPGTDQVHEARRTWYFLSPASCHQSAGGGSTRMRQRAIRGGRGGEFWRSEAGKKEVQDTGGRAMGYTRTLYYVARTPGSSSASFKRLGGWCMIEYWLEQQDGGADQQLVLCKVYRSNKHLQISAAAASSGFGDPILRAPFRVANNVDSVPCRPHMPVSRMQTTCVCESGTPAKAAAEETRDWETALAVVMALGGSSISSAEGIKKMAKHVLGNSIVVLSAMGKTTNNILLAAEKAVSCGDQKASEIPELALIKDLHLRTAFELGLDWTIVSGLLSELEQNLQCVASTKELTPAKQHYLVSIGERLSTTIFSSYLKKLGKRTRQYAFDVGFKTMDGFTNEDIIESTYPTIAKKLQGDWIEDSAIPIVTSSIGKGCKSCAITTLGSDWTAMIIGKALGLGEIQIWKHVNGVLTTDPNICTNAMPIPNLTFDEATELAYSGAKVLHLQAMRLAIGGGIQIIKVKNADNPQAPGTMITETRDCMSMSILSSIALKSNIIMFNIVSKGVLSQHDFKAQVFSIFKDRQICVDHEATSGINICLKLDLSKLSNPELIQRKLDSVVEQLEKVAIVSRQQQSIISLVGNIRKSSFILAKAFSALERIGVNAQNISQRSSKVMNVSLVVHENEAIRCVQVLHSAFLEDGFVSKVEGADDECPVPVNSSMAASSSGVKRKAVYDHPETPPSARQERADTDPNGPEETDRTTFSEKYPMPVGDGNGGPLGASAIGLAEVAEGGRVPGNALDDLLRILLSEDDPMQAGGDNGRYPDGFWAGILEGNDNTGVLPVGVGGGEQDMRQAAPAGSVTEEDAGQGSTTAPDGPEETEHPLSPDNDQTAGGGDNIGDPEDFFRRIINEDVDIQRLHVDDYQVSEIYDVGDCARMSSPLTPLEVEGDEFLQTPIDDQVEEYLQSPIDLDVSTSEAEPEQLAEGGSRVEVLLEEFSPDDLLGPPPF